MNDEELFQLRMKAARGDPAARGQLEEEQQRLEIEVNAKRAAWGHRPPLQSTILTRSYVGEITVSDCEVLVRDRNSQIMEVIDWPE